MLKKKFTFVTKFGFKIDISIKFFHKKILKLTRKTNQNENIITKRSASSSFDYNSSVDSILDTIIHTSFTSQYAEGFYNKIDNSSSKDKGVYKLLDSPFGSFDESTTDSQDINVFDKSFINISNFPGTIAAIVDNKQILFVGNDSFTTTSSTLYDSFPAIKILLKTDVSHICLKLFIYSTLLVIGRTIFFGSILFLYFHSGVSHIPLEINSFPSVDITTPPLSQDFGILAGDNTAKLVELGTNLYLT